jgi:hypothetical protein
MHGHGRRDQPDPARLAREEERTGGECRPERVAAGRERVQSRGDPAQRRRGGRGPEHAHAPG